MEANKIPILTTLSDAIKTKYVEAENNLPDNNSSDGFVILVRVHGAGDRNNHYGIPRNLVLENLGINACGDKDFLIEKCRDRVNEIDLSCNKLTDWNEVGQVASSLASKISFLNLGYNDLSSPMTEEHLIEKLPNLKSLILVGTNINWASLWKFLEAGNESLDELNLSKNNFNSIELPNPILAFPTVTKLMFNGNPIKSWDEVSKLGLIFPNLEQLGLSDCEINLIPENAGLNFRNLTTLWLSSNPLKEMDDIMNLRNFAKLADLRILGTKILPQFTDFERRQFIIALLPNITKVNGGACISINERETAERSFIRHFDNNSDAKPPTRYNELKTKHGELHPLVDIDLKPVKTVNLRFTLDEILIEKSVSVYLTTSELKVFLEPLIGIQPKKQRLFYVARDPVEGEVFGIEEMRFPNKQLYSYSMKDGDEIQIDIKN